MDLQADKFVYTSGISLRSAELVEFKKMVNLLHPCYQTPTKQQLAGDLLDTVHNDVTKELAKILRLLSYKMVGLQ